LYKHLVLIISLQGYMLQKRKFQKR